LLEWLASDFMAHGWRLKRLHKLVMTSTVYRQSSQRHAKGDHRDPENRLYWRKPIHRLDAEVIRDAMLCASGALNENMFGPPVPVRPDVHGQIVVGVDKTQGDNKMPVEVSLKGEEFRRSVYIQVRRSRPLAMLHAFDAPVMETNCEKRQSSTVATQSLMLMNSQFILDQAALFARRLRKDAVDPPSQITRAWQLAFSRSPTANELAGALEFLSSQATAKPKDELQPLTNVCQALLSANEFLYVD
jgi:Protein of unknown function (DUF1553)